MLFVLFYGVWLAGSLVSMWTVDVDRDDTAVCFLKMICWPIRLLLRSTVDRATLLLPPGDGV